MGDSAAVTNYQGSTLSDSDKDTLVSKGGSMFSKGTDPQGAAQMFMNWLTGGQPTKVDPSKIFKDRSLLQPQEQRAAAGSGMVGLFGVGSMIGDIAPIEPIKPINQSPMQPGVPYSVPPVPAVGGGKK